MDNIERRGTVHAEIKIEKRSDGKRELKGYAAVFDSLSTDLGGFRERISRGAFSESVRVDDVRCLIDHDPSRIIARNKSGTLKLDEDSKGLRFEASVADTQAGRDVITSVERGDLSQCSFAFQVAPGGQEWDDKNGQLIRTLNRVKLYDVSIVSYAAYEQTSVVARALLDQGRRAVGKGSLSWEIEADIRRRKLDLIVKMMSPEARTLYDIQLLRAQRSELQAKYGR